MKFSNNSESYKISAPDGRTITQTEKVVLTKLVGDIMQNAAAMPNFKAINPAGIVDLLSGTTATLTKNGLTVESNNPRKFTARILVNSLKDSSQNRSGLYNLSAFASN